TPRPPATSNAETKATAVATSAPGGGPPVAATFGPVANEAVAFQTDDGVTVRRHFYAGPGPKRKIVVLAHQNGSDQKSWAEVTKVATPKLFVASRSDPDGAAGALTSFVQAAANPKDSKVYDGTAHGTELLQGANAAAFKQRVLEFIQK